VKNIDVFIIPMWQFLNTAQYDSQSFKIQMNRVVPNRVDQHHIKSGGLEITSVIDYWITHNFSATLTQNGVICAYKPTINY
jgi:hypothetical protein